MADADAPAVKPKRPRRQREPSFADSPDPVEIAMKAVATGADRHSAARAVLEKHACLIDIQCRREREELGNVRVQRITRWLILAALAALTLGLISVVWAASRSTALVVEPFRVPQDMAQRGVDGPAVAAQLLDRLSDLQERTQSARAASSYANDWGDNLAVAIPETGISVSEAWRFLRASLGNETRITGEVWRAPDGSITVTARAGANPARSFSGSEGEFNALMSRAAEAVYSVTQPYRFFVYANNEARYPEAEASLRRILLASDPEEKKWAHIAAANLERQRGELDASDANARAALAIDPRLSSAVINFSTNAGVLDHNEQRLRYVRRGVELQRLNLGDSRYDHPTLKTALTTNLGTIAGLQGDLKHAVEVEQVLGGLNPSRARVMYVQTARWYVELHDLAAATRSLEALKAFGGGAEVDNAAILSDQALRIAVARGEAPAIRRELAQAVVAADRYAGHPSRYKNGLGRLWKARTGWSSEAAALSALGEHQAAVAIAERTASDCYSCLLTFGGVLAAAGDRQRAEETLRKAVRQGPSLPFGYSELGRVRLLAGDRAGAIRMFQQAHARGPGYADALKYWGDALIAGGSVREGERRYAMAAERAPRWGALHLDWANALWRLGRREAAVAKLRAAAAMDLSVADKLRFDRMLAGAARPG